MDKRLEVAPFAAANITISPGHELVLLKLRHFTTAAQTFDESIWTPTFSLSLGQAEEVLKDLSVTVAALQQIALRNRQGHQH